MSDTIWIRNLTGEKAVIPAADRDRWKLHGWTEADEPVDGDFVWMEHPDDGIAKPGPIPWAARDYWLGVGWAPSAPPEPVNPALDPVLNDNAARAEPSDAAARKADSRRPTKTAAASAAPSKEE